MVRTVLCQSFAVLWVVCAAPTPRAFAGDDRGQPGRATRTREDPALLEERKVEIDAAVRRGLTFLAAQQNPRGFWLGDLGHKQGDDYHVYRTRHEEQSEGTGHVGVTALAGLAFLAAGHLPGRGPYARVIDSTTDYLLAHIEPSGYVHDEGTRMYSHAFATLYLSQVYGMTRGDRERVERGLRAAVQLIVDCQNSFGAWRYTPYTNEGDLSVTVCQLQALRAAREAGVSVPYGSIERALDYLRKSRASDGWEAGTFYYKIQGRGAYGRTTFAINAAAVTALHSAGVYDPQLYGKALEFLADNYGELSRFYGSHYYFWYGNYYAVQAMHMEGGKPWERYWRRLRDDLLARQEPKGNWVNDTGPGDEFATAIACLMLMVRDEWLPIFQR